MTEGDNGSTEQTPGTLLPRAFFERPGPEVAVDLLGAVVVSDLPPGRVAVRLTEVEAYHGADDPGSHAFRGRTPRNAVMFGPPGRCYVYFTYGMHWCMNVVCGPEGLASAVLLRAGQVTEGLETARQRRSVARNDRDLARGPARLAVALGVDGSCNGADGADARSPLRVVRGLRREGAVQAGPRVGVGGAGAATPWRFWLEGDPTVSPYRAHAPRRRRKPGTPEVPRTG